MTSSNMERHPSQPPSGSVWASVVKLALALVQLLVVLHDPSLAIDVTVML
ncbi:hypothetical protein [Saccharopolyspora mangrovi]|uniref:Uncharacterized protein n=1 Tax=Saccharopolyspora mangrovi TaxID=3082379 RepID=A0ABU6A3N1_9PSEU|nr:hypothetical protein [Saccharopolyspora sp. S2-29]MEB3366188.1 hypothetical protein [Saccharopolyspora sp. S2-29]